MLTTTSSPSPLAKNYVSCCKLFGANVMIPEFDRNFDHLSFLQEAGKWYNFARVSASTIAFFYSSY
jgi:hypothetical protein